MRFQCSLTRFRQFVIFLKNLREIRLESALTYTWVLFQQELVVKFQDLQIEHTAKYNEMKYKRKSLFCLQIKQTPWLL